MHVAACRCGYTTDSSDLAAGTAGAATSALLTPPVQAGLLRAAQSRLATRTAHVLRACGTNTYSVASWLPLCGGINALPACHWPAGHPQYHCEPARSRQRLCRFVPDSAQLRPAVSSVVHRAAEPGRPQCRIAPAAGPLCTWSIVKSQVQYRTGLPTVSALSFVENVKLEANKRQFSQRSV